MIAVVACTQVLTGQASAAQRGYERVSTPDRNNFDVFGFGKMASSPVGDKIVYMVGGPVPGTSAGTISSKLGATRTGPGLWSSENLMPPAASSVPFELPEVLDISLDASKAVVTSFSPITSDAIDGSNNLFLRLSATSYRLLTPAGLGKGSFTFAGANAAFDHLAYEATAPQVPGISAGNIYPYEWFDGQVRLVGILPDPDGPGPQQGQPAPDGARIGSSAGVGSVNHAISNDGRQIVFHTVEPSPVSSRDGQLYVRKNGTSTLHVSASQRTDCAGDTSCGEDNTADPLPDPAGPLPARFWDAEAERGNGILFSSCEKLTDDSTAEAVVDDVLGAGCEAGIQDGVFTLAANDLYIFYPDTKKLIDITTQDPNGAKVLGVVGVSDDLSYVYFVAHGQLVPGAEAGKPNLYVWHDGVPKLVAVLDPTTDDGSFGGASQDSNNWALTSSDKAPVSRVSPSGKRMLFTSRASVDPTFNNESSDCVTGHCAEIYLYDAVDDELTCISCPASGEPVGDARLHERSIRTGGPLPRNLTNDGERAYFETLAPLVPSDSNGRTDVYEWDDGHISLISTGTGKFDARFVDASETGNDVFFLTRDQLTGADEDSLIDLYDARVGGGTPEPPLVRPCEGSACLGPPSPPPALVEPATKIVTSSGNFAGSPRPLVRIRKVDRRQRAALARGRAISISVSVRRRGVVTLVGRSKIGKRRRTVLQGRSRARHREAVRVRVRLSTIGARALSRRGRLTIRLVTRLRGTSEVARQSVRLSARKGVAK